MITYGKGIKSTQDEVMCSASINPRQNSHRACLSTQYVVNAERALRNVGRAAVPGQFIVNLIPSCSCICAGIQYLMLTVYNSSDCYPILVPRRYIPKTCDRMGERY
jgi:hypothetical protein